MLTPIALLMLLCGVALWFWSSRVLLIISTVVSAALLLVAFTIIGGSIEAAIVTTAIFEAIFVTLGLGVLWLRRTQIRPREKS